MLRAVGEQAGVRLRAARPPRARRRAGSTWSAAPARPARASRTCWATSCGCRSRPCSTRSTSSRARASRPCMPPVMVREEALVRHGLLPDRPRAVYAVANDDRAVPGRHVRGARSRRCTRARSSTRTSCRCATAGSRPASGARPARRASDTRGIFRTHQFEKVEMFSFCHPDRSWDEHEWLLSIEREIAADARPALPRHEHRGRATSARRRPRSTTSRCGCRARAATAS